MIGLINEIRSLGTMTALYRILASLAGCAALYGIKHGGTPLAGAHAACHALAIASDWTTPFAGWIGKRHTLVGGLATLVIGIGLLTLPGPQQFGLDLTEILEWRGPSTIVLGLAFVIQVDYVWQALLGVAPFAAFGIWAAGWEKDVGHRWERVGAATAGLVLALFFVPLYVGVWLFTRDVRSATQRS